ncbi:MAG: DedA family protein [Chloroflexota bacterium]
MDIIMDIDITTLVLGWVINYGAPMIFCVLILSGMGLPLPAVLIVIAAGAFIRQELLSLYTTPILGLIGVVTGDSVVYGVGRFGNRWIEQRFGSSSTWRSAQQQFEKRGGIAIYLTRWLITPLAVPTNLVAGGSRYSFGRFLAYDTAGEITWLALFGGLGYAFGDQWSLITDLVTNFSGLLASILAVAVGIYLMVWYMKRQRNSAGLAVQT